MAQGARRGLILSLLTAVGGGVLTWRNWSGPTAFDADTSRVWSSASRSPAAMGAVLASAGAASSSAWSPWVVGVHLIPVARLVRSPSSP